MTTMPELAPGSVKINIAEFIAALITCETYADYCVDKITVLEVDNITAKAWLKQHDVPEHHTTAVRKAVTYTG